MFQALIISMYAVAKPFQNYLIRKEFSDALRTEVEVAASPRLISRLDCPQ